MKHNDIENAQVRITEQNLESIFNVYQDSNGLYCYNLSKTVYFPEDLDPTYYTFYSTAPKDTWTLIAHKTYGDVRLWWLVCAVNAIEDPTSHPEPNTKIKLLSPMMVKSILSELAVE